MAGSIRQLTCSKKIALNANKVRVKPLRVILNGLGKDAAMIISRINGFTYVETEFDPYTEEVAVLSETAYSKGARAKVKCYGSDSVPAHVEMMGLIGAGNNPQAKYDRCCSGCYRRGSQIIRIANYLQ